MNAHPYTGEKMWHFKKTWDNRTEKLEKGAEQCHSFQLSSKFGAYDCFGCVFADHSELTPFLIDQGWLLLAVQSSKNRESVSWTVIHGCVMVSWFDWEFVYSNSLEILPPGIWVHLQYFGFAEIMICRIGQF